MPKAVSWHCQAQRKSNPSSKCPSQQGRTPQRPEAASQSAAIKHLGTAREPRYGPSHKPKSIAIRDIATMNSQQLRVETNRENDTAGYSGFGAGVFLQARWAALHPISAFGLSNSYSP